MGFRFGATSTFGVGNTFGGPITSPKGASATTLRREADGTVTILSLARTWNVGLFREADGSVTVN